MILIGAGSLRVRDAAAAAGRTLLPGKDKAADSPKAGYLSGAGAVGADDLIGVGVVFRSVCQGGELK